MRLPTWTWPKNTKFLNTNDKYISNTIYSAFASAVLASINIKSIYYLCRRNSILYFMKISQDKHLKDIAYLVQLYNSKEQRSSWSYILSYKLDGYAYACKKANTCCMWMDEVFEVVMVRCMFQERLIKLIMNSLIGVCHHMLLNIY